jgi:hypothetical protein
MRALSGMVRSWLAALGGEPVYRLAAIGVVLVAFGGLAAAVLLWPDDRSSATPRLQQAPVTVKRGLSTGSALFGDTVEAEIDVVSDDRRVPPDSVRLETDFRPLTVVGTTVERERRGAATLLRTVVVLRCATVACLPPRDGRPVRFAAATVRYRLDGRARAVAVPWRGLVVHSRLSGDPAAAEGITDAPPALSTGFARSPTVVVAVLVLLAIALGLVGALLVVQGLWPRFFYSLGWWRTLSPLSQSLLQVEAAASIDDEAVRRGALDRLATQLEAAQAPELGGEARRLAWGPTAPGPAELTGFVGRVRAGARKAGR